MIPDSFLAVDYMLDRFTLARRGARRPRASACARTSTRASGSSTASGCCSRSSTRASTRDDAYRLVQRNALRAWDEQVGFREPRRGRPGDRRPRRPRRRLRRRCVRRPRRHRLRAPARARRDAAGGRACLRRATHLASGKVREIYALDDDRLLLVASDRISTFDVILPTPIPDKGRVLTGMSGVLVRPHAVARAEPPARPRRRRPLDDLPAAADAAGRARRPRVPVRLRLGRLPRDRVGVRPRAAAGLRESDRLPEPIVTPGDEGGGGARPQHHRGRGGRAVRRGGVRRRAGGGARSCTRSRRGTPRSAGSSSPTPSSSSASMPKGS